MYNDIFKLERKNPYLVKLQQKGGWWRITRFVNSGL